MSEDIITTLNEFVDDLNEAMGFPLCLARAEPLFGVCTLDNGHEGDHMAETMDGSVYRQWPQLLTA